MLNWKKEFEFGTLDKRWCRIAFFRNHTQNCFFLHRFNNCSRRCNCSDGYAIGLFIRFGFFGFMFQYSKYWGSIPCKCDEARGAYNVSLYLSKINPTTMAVHHRIKLGKLTIKDLKKIRKVLRGAGVIFITILFALPVFSQSMDEMKSKVRKYFPNDYKLVYRIIQCESGWNPNAVSKTHDYGLMQINRIWWNRGELGDGAWRNVDYNLLKAKYVYSIQGWRAWGCYKKMRRR